MIPFIVTLYPAHKVGATGLIGFCMRIGAGEEYPSLRFEAKNTAQAVRNTELFAAQHGKACHASVQCLGPRKPNGFDRGTTGLYFNMDVAPVQ